MPMSKTTNNWYFRRRRKDIRTIYLAAEDDKVWQHCRTFCTPGNHRSTMIWRAKFLAVARGKKPPVFKCRSAWGNPCVWLSWIEVGEGWLLDSPVATEYKTIVIQEALTS